MTETYDLSRLRLLAKRFARSNAIAQHFALDLIAGQLGFPNWVKLVTAGKNGWEPGAQALAAVETFAAGAMPAVSIRSGDAAGMGERLAHVAQADSGTIGNHPYRLHDVLQDVVMAGDGWSIRVPENPGATVLVETYTAPGAPCPVLDPQFLDVALGIARERARRVRREISTDWPRRSTKPDLDGVVRHPLSGRESKTWFCYHCDAKITGAAIAQNLWHCPGCAASPLDIYPHAFWAEDGGASFRTVTRADASDRLPVKVVDGRPLLDLGPQNVALLMRSALVEDAADVSERIGALHAEISVDDDGDVWIILDVDLWPEDKDTESVFEVARFLGIEVEVACTFGTIPFAWPGLGTTTSSTAEYAQMMVEAYAAHGNVPRKANGQSRDGAAHAAPPPSPPDA